jgi:hypothetical protein
VQASERAVALDVDLALTGCCERAESIVHSQRVITILTVTRYSAFSGSADPNLSCAEHVRAAHAHASVRFSCLVSARDPWKLKTQRKT